MPGRIITRLMMTSPFLEDSEILSDGWELDVEAPDTPKVNINFSVNLETFKEWINATLPTFFDGYAWCLGTRPRQGLHHDVVNDSGYFA
jgi:hypothetical protein